MRGSERTRHVPHHLRHRRRARSAPHVQGLRDAAPSTSSTSRSSRTSCGTRRTSSSSSTARSSSSRSELRERTETLRLNEMFTAVLGHDLRNPLSAILTGAQLLERRSDDEAVRETAGRMLSSGKRMSRMIEDMLDLARARLAGGIPLQARAVDLGALVAPRRAGAPGRVPGAQHRRGAARATCTGEWDADRLAQVASNLIGNALQHGDGERAGPRRARRHAARRRSCCRSTNAGTIPPEVLPHIFDPFRGGQRQAGPQRGPRPRPLHRPADRPRAPGQRRGAVAERRRTPCSA